MRGEHGQGLIEAVAAVPVCIVCALAIVDCGVVLRDRIATTHAATNAAAATIAGRDAERAARAALPARAARGARVRIEGDAVEVVTKTRPALLAGRAGITLRSRVELPVEVAR